MRERLLALPFPDYVACVARLLTALGYRNVRLMGVIREKGRNAFGGMDLSADQGQGLTASRVIAQVKQYKEPVPRTFVDELRGTMLRVGASQGILVTTSEFSRSASDATLSGQHAAPVRLVDGYELARLMNANRLDMGERAWSGFLASGHDEPKKRNPRAKDRPGARRMATRPAVSPPDGTETGPVPVPLPPERPGLTVTVTVRGQGGGASCGVASRR